MTATVTAIYPARFHQADYKRTVHLLIVEPRTTQAQLKSPDFWANLAPKCKMGDLVEIEPDDGTFFALYKIRDVGKHHVTVSEVYFTDFVNEKTESVKQDGYYVKWRGQQLMYCIIREGTDKPVKEGFGTKELAQSELAEYLKTV